MGGGGRNPWILRLVVLASVLAIVGGVVLSLVWLMKPKEYDLMLSTGSEGGTYLPLGRGMAEVIEQAYPSIKVKVLQSSGAVENMARLESGEADLALIQNDTKGATTVRTVLPLYREVLHFMVRNDTGIASLRDIRGKRVSIGERGSGTEALVMALLRHFDLDLSNFEPRFLGAGDATDALISGEIDAMLLVVGIKSEACQKAVASGQVHFVGLGTAGIDADEVEGFRFDYPFAEPYVIPILTYSARAGGKPERPISTIAIRAVLAARSDLPDDVVRRATAAIFAGRTNLIREYGNATEIRERFDETWLQYPVHSGAQAYYRRDEPGFLITYAELMGFILSVVVFFVATFAGVREAIIRRKKNRIDVYYMRLDQILTELRTDAPEEERLEELDEELDEMQRRAFKQLVAEQLRADESFRIFQDFLAQTKTAIGDIRTGRAELLGAE